MDGDRFGKRTVEILAKRAANLCSNPDCGTVTSGPAEESDRAVSVGEAAHIFGARPGSARYDALMSPVDRGDITNGVWLCRNCHKLIDGDPTQYPAGLLFEWRREHEQRVAETVGKTGAAARQRYLERHLREFGDTSYRAQQIIMDKPPAWEYRLTTELLRTKLSPVTARWRALERGLYAKPVNRISLDEIVDWLRGRMREISEQAPAISLIVNEEFQVAWGEPGVLGSETEILRTTELLTEAAERLLEWEERVRFAQLPEAFEEVQELMIGVAGGILSKLAVIPVRMGEIFDQEDVSGQHEIQLIMDVPEGWAEKFEAAVQHAGRAAFAD